MAGIWDPTKDIIRTEPASAYVFFWLLHVVNRIQRLARHSACPCRVHNLGVGAHEEYTDDYCNREEEWALGSEGQDGMMLWGDVITWLRSTDLTQYMMGSVKD